jgi:GT2 family glycosyltransferase
MKSILIIIVTWNKKDYVLQLLASLDGLDYPRDKLDVVVVDNASNDGTVEALREQYPNINLICNSENIGGTGGFNTGLQWAFQQPEEKYDYLWLLDNDVVVHRQALNELVSILDENPDVGVAGSTMMQLDYPWRINEMGGFFNTDNGQLFLHRHFEEIPNWQSIDALEVNENKNLELADNPALTNHKNLKLHTAFMHHGPLLLHRHFEEIPNWRSKDVLELASNKDLKLSKTLMHCRRFMDVDYVAAASLLIRAKLAKQIGIWRDFFIHYDDVEWCLRIGEMGWRVTVAADSIIWHLSAAAKIPTWVLYYDNRNVLVTLQKHGANAQKIHQNVEYILKKAVYYALLGKPDLSQLHIDAVNDFYADQLGKKNIQLTTIYRSNSHIEEVFSNSQVKRILIGNVNLQATGIQSALVKAILKRKDLEITFLTEPNGARVYQIPRAKFLQFPTQRFKRYLQYWRLRNQFDVVFQSDYAPYPLIGWLGKQIAFINDEGFCINPSPKIKDVWRAGVMWLKHRFHLG